MCVKPRCHDLFAPAAVNPDPLDAFKAYASKCGKARTERVVTPPSLRGECSSLYAALCTRKDVKCNADTTDFLGDPLKSTPGMVIATGNNTDMRICYKGLGWCTSASTASDNAATPGEFWGMSDASGSFLQTQQQPLLVALYRCEVLRVLAITASGPPGRCTICMDARTQPFLLPCRMPGICCSNQMPTDLPSFC